MQAAGLHGASRLRAGGWPNHDTQTHQSYGRLTSIYSFLREPAGSDGPPASGQSLSLGRGKLLPRCCGPTAIHEQASHEIKVRAVETQYVKQTPPERG